MMMIPRHKLVRHTFSWLAVELLAATIAFAFAFNSIDARQKDQIAATDRITLPGLSNAARVSNTLYRGAQPHPEGFAELKKLGIAVVVDFRDGSGGIHKEKERVEAQGMTFVSIPWNAHHDPSRDVITTFFTTLHDNPGKKIFVHCERGADRTGTMIALYRITYDHWTPDQAVREMNAFHYWSSLLPHLARYVEAFPTTLANDPTLAGQALPTTQR